MKAMEQEGVGEQERTLGLNQMEKKARVGEGYSWVA